MGLLSNISRYSLIAGVIPILLSLPILFLKKEWHENLRGILLTFFLGSLMQFIYVALFTNIYCLWWWYYVAPIILLTFLINMAMARWLPNKAFYFKVYVSLIILGLALFYYDKTRKPYFYAPAIYACNWLDQNNTKGASILVSDFPGYLGFFSGNRIIAADMLTSCGCFYKKMKERGNALDYLIEECERKNKH